MHGTQMRITGDTEMRSRRHPRRPARRTRHPHHLRPPPHPPRHPRTLPRRHHRHRERPRPHPPQTRRPPPAHRLPPPAHRRPHRISHKAYPPSSHHRHPRRHRTHHQSCPRSGTARPPRRTTKPPHPQPLTPTPPNRQNSADQHKHQPILYALTKPTTNQVPLSPHDTTPAHTPNHPLEPCTRPLSTNPQHTRPASP